MFGISHLKKSYVRTPTDKTVNNISDCRSECSKASDSTNPSGDMVTSQRATQDVDSTKLKEVFHMSLIETNNYHQKKEISNIINVADKNDIV